MKSLSATSSTAASAYDSTRPRRGLPLCGNRKAAPKCRAGAAFSPNSRSQHSGQKTRNRLRLPLRQARRDLRKNGPLQSDAPDRRMTRGTLFPLRLVRFPHEADRRCGDGSMDERSTRPGGPPPDPQWSKADTPGGGVGSTMGEAQPTPINGPLGELPQCGTAAGPWGDRSPPSQGQQRETSCGNPPLARALRPASREEIALVLCRVGTATREGGPR